MNSEKGNRVYFSVRPMNVFFLKGQFFHEEVDLLVHFEAVQIVGIALKPHEQPAVGSVGRPAKTQRLKNV